MVCPNGARRDGALKPAITVTLGCASLTAMRTPGHTDESTLYALNGDDTPEQILKRRYAKGEIERDEYQRRLEDLRR